MASKHKVSFIYCIPWAVSLSILWLRIRRRTMNLVIFIIAPLSACCTSLWQPRTGLTMASVSLINHIKWNDGDGIQAWITSWSTMIFFIGDSWTSFSFLLHLSMMKKSRKKRENHKGNGETNWFYVGILTFRYLFASQNWFIIVNILLMFLNIHSNSFHTDAPLFHK